MVKKIGHFIGGAELAGSSGREGDVFDPNTGEVQSRVALANAGEVGDAIATAKAAQPEWAAQNPQRRARVFFRFVDVLNLDRDANESNLATD